MTPAPSTIFYLSSLANSSAMPKFFITILHFSLMTIFPGLKLRLVIFLDCMAKSNYISCLKILASELIHNYCQRRIPTLWATQLGISLRASRRWHRSCSCCAATCSICRRSRGWFSWVFDLNRSPLTLSGEVVTALLLGVRTNDQLLDQILFFENWMGSHVGGNCIVLDLLPS